jgi:hypothetical protein
MSRWLARLALIGALLVTGASFLLTFVVWLGVSTGRLSPELAEGAAQISLSSVLDAFTALAIAVVAALIITNRSGNRLGWVMLLLGFSIALSGFSRAYAGIGMGGFDGVLPGLVLAAWVSQVIWFMIFFTLELLLLLFPTGMLLSPRWRWVVAAALLITVCALALLAVGTPIEVPGGQVANPIGLIPFERVERYLAVLFIPFLLTLVLALLSLALRFHRAAGIERQQIKWLLYVAALSVTALLATSFGVIGGQFTSLVALGYPIAIGIAVLRYRLYDIDVVIRKTLLYAVLTALLALVYFGVVILLQGLFSRLAGVQQSTLAVVISTLAIAALFTPLRRRVQDAIDRRFYRKKYDAQQVLAQFAQTARDETDLDALLAELVRVVDETLQPEHVSIWLRDTKSPKGG